MPRWCEELMNSQAWNFFVILLSDSQGQQFFLPNYFLLTFSFLPLLFWYLGNPFLARYFPFFKKYCNYWSCPFLTRTNTVATPTRKINNHTFKKNIFILPDVAKNKTKETRFATIRNGRKLMMTPHEERTSKMNLCYHSYTFMQTLIPQSSSSKMLYHLAFVLRNY